MFNSRLFLTYFLTNIIEVLCIWLLWWFNRTALPTQIPFNFVNSWGESQLIATTNLWQFPLVLTVSLGIGVLICWYFWKREKLYSQYVIASMMFVHIISVASLVRLVIRFG